MFISKKNRLAVYSYLFKEGTLVAKKDPYLEKHSEDVPIPNLEVICLLKTFKSKGFVTETFNWQCHYYYLTNEGIEYLRQYLSLPADIVPATLKVVAQKQRPGAENQEGGKKNFSGSNFNPEFKRERRGEYRN